MKKSNLVKSLTRVINNITSLPFREGLGLGRMLILCLSLATFGVGNVCGEYYVLQNQGTSSIELMNGWSSSTDKSYTLTGPGAQLSFEVEKVNDGMFGATGNITVKAGSTTIQTIKMSDLSKKNTWYKYSVDLTKYDNYKTNRSITFSASGTLAKYLRSAQVTMAQYLEEPSSTDEMAWGAGKVDDTNVTKSITIAWCNVPALTYTVTGSGKDQVSVVIENNSEYGKYNTATVKVTYNRNAASTLDATLTISNTYSSYSKSIKLSGSTTKYNQSLSWENESSIEPNMMVGATPTIKAISNQGQTVTYTSSNSDVLSVDTDGKLTAKSVGEATITASQAGDYKYNAATSISKTFNVKTKDTPIFTPNWSSTNIKVGDKVTLGVQYVSDGLNGNFKAAYNSTIFNVTREGNTITIEALNEGDASVAFTQTETSSIFSASKTYSFSVSKIANTLSVANASPTMYVGDNLVDKISTNSDATINVSSNDETVAHYDLSSQTIIAQNTNNQSFNSKEVMITISQAATYKYTAAEKTITVTVNKHVPTFTWSNATLYHNQSYNDFFTTNGTNTLTVKSSSDDNVAYLVDGANAQKLNLKTLTKAASTTLTVTQAENYYWAEYTESKTITPSVAPNHVPFTYNEAMFNDGNITITKAGTSNIFMVDNGRYVQLGENATTVSGGDAWKDKYIVIKFDGIPEKVSFEYATSSGASTSPDFKVYESSNGTNFNEIFSDNRNSSSWSSTITKDLSRDTRYLKFFFDGNYGGQYQHITVTELKTFSIDKSSLDFGSNKKDIACASQTLTFNYANVGHKVTLTTNDPHFTVSPTSITNIGGEKYGSQTITVSYSTTEVHSATNAKLTIKDELGNSKEITLSGSTAKKTQTISWVSPYDVEEPAIPIGKTITGAATSSSNLGVIYESSDPSVIEILDDGIAFKALTTGSATITAKQVGTDDWEAASISKTFKGTNKIIQVISWNQNFTRLLTTYNAQDLTAIVNLENAETGAQTYSKERSDLITYTSQDNSVVSVSGSTLNIVGIGTTTLTASVSGDDLYESATVTIPVTVRAPSDGCEDVLLGTDFGSGEYEFFHMNISDDMEKEVKIDRNTSAIPGVLSFQHKGKKWGLSYSGEIAVYESTNNGSSWTKLGAVTPSEGTYNKQTYPLSRNATHVKFFRGKSAKGYHYIKNVEISPAQFIESNANNNAIDFENVTVNSVEERTIVLSYANVKDNLTITKSSDDLTLSCGDIIDLDCGATGTNIITITFTPNAVGDFSDDITFFDKNSKQNYTLNIKAKVVKSTQHITWEPTQTEYRTIDQIVLNAIASSTYPVKYYVKEGTDVADFENGVLIIKKDGQITIRAYEPGDAIYEAAVDVDKTFTIRKTNLHFDPLPTAATITYPQALSESALTGGVVKDEEGNVVAGTIAWTTSTTQLNAGENQSQEITFTPTTNPAWYNTLSSSTTITVLKANPNASAQAGDIVYGAKVASSPLTNTGTTEGAWTWNDDKKEQVLAVGTHEGLKVHFTPTDQTNYNEIDGTVSLTITAATPTLTWTATPEAAQVHETKTFTASSTNTDNTAAITYSIISGSDCATINETTGEVTMTKAGTITVQASQVATTNFNAPEPIETTCTISLAPTTITTNPTISSDIVSGTALNEIVLEGGAVQNTINNQAVEGTFAVTAGETTAVGEQTLTITFTPTEADKYASCTTTISATVIKRTPTQEEVGTPSAADIEYGAAVNTSVLTGNGTLDGTWSWIDNRKYAVLPVGTHDGLQVRFTPIDGNVHTVDAVVSLTITGEMENKFIGNGNWEDAQNWTNGVPTGENPNIVVSGSLTIHEPISIGGLTIEQSGEVNIVDNGDLTVNGTSADRETYGNLFVRNGGNITIHENAEVKVYDFVVESSIGTQNGTSISGQVENSNKVIYTNGAYIDINMDPDGTMDDTQWYGFTVPFPVDVQNGVARKEGETFSKCTYGSDYMIAEYDMNQRLNTGKGWKYIKTGKLQPGHFYYLTVNGKYNTYSFKAAETTFTIQTKTAITTNGDGANANWNAVGNSTLMYAEVSGENLPNYVQTYVNGESRYQVVSTTDAQFVVGCPFFIQATKATTMVLNKATEMQNILHYAPRSEETAQPICVRIAEEGQRFSDQMYITASEDALDTYELGRDLAKAGIGTKSAQLWVNAYKQSLCVNDAPLIDKKAYYDVTLYAPKAGSYEISLPRIPNNGTLYLTQNGMPMWNLNESAYSIECAKGNNSEYGLLFIESEPSGDGSMTNNPTLNDNNQWQKVLVNQHVYILQNGSVYDITGQKVK